MSHPITRGMLAAALLVAAVGGVRAQASATVVITGNPLRDGSGLSPTDAIAGDELVTGRGLNLGDLLQSRPGVAASGFGPHASRPVIRGQDGDRIRLLANGGASLDASALSSDHAVAIDPLVIERVEVLRGPAALLYGGSAVGGVVNTIDNRIPVSPLSGVGGAAEIRGGGAARERAAAAVLEGGVDGWAWHADAFGRRTSDLRVPTGPGRVDNSASRGEGGALGASRVWNDGHLGVSVDRYRNHYGVVVEEDVTIRMQRERLALSGEWRALPGVVQTVRALAARTDYGHDEIEGAVEIGTRFDQQGTDLRLEAVQAPFALAGGALAGVLGVQAESSRFEALGEEAFVPPTRSRQAALFTLQRWSRGDWQLQAGLRTESARVQARDGSARERRFSPLSTAVGLAWVPDPAWRVGLQLSRSERAPTFYELYADGVHVATAAYERGDPQQPMERGRNVEASWRWARGGGEVALSVFEHRFDRYLLLRATGEPDFVDDEGEAFPVFAFESVRARLRGAEIEGRWRPTSDALGSLPIELTARADTLRGDDLTHGEPLPRLQPWRVAVGARWGGERWQVQAEVIHAGRAGRVPAGDTPTPGWTRLDLGAHWRLGADGRTLLFVRLNNASDELAFNATAIATVRALSPQPGRSLAAGVRHEF